MAKFSDKKQIYQITCPYCYERFSHENVHFRASSNRHYEGNSECNFPVIDRKLTEYRQKYNLDTAKMAPCIVPDNSIGGIDYVKCIGKGYNTDGVLIQLVDEFDMPSTVRLCPSCHNVLPKSAGRMKSCIVAIIGDTSVGKTIYMTTLIDALQKKVSINFDADCKPVDFFTFNNFNDKYYTPMYRNGLLPAPTMKNEINYPLVFELNLGRRYITKDEWEADKSVILAFYDVAGEGMRDKRYLETFGKHLHFADAYIFLVDPLQTAITSRIAVKSGVEDANKRDSAVTIVNALEANEIIDVKKLTAIVLTKSDLLRNIGDDYLHEHSNVFRKTNYQGYLDLMEVESVNEEVRKFLERADRVFLHYIDRTFRRFAFFAVSSLGNPVSAGADGKKYITGGAPDPLRVEEPFLWILYKMGYISGEEAEKKGFSLTDAFRNWRKKDG